MKGVICLSKKIIFIVLSILGILALLFVVFRDNKNNIPNIKPDVYVYDFASMVSRDEEIMMNNMLKEFEVKSGIKFRVVSIKNEYEEGIEKYAERVFDDINTSPVSQEILIVFCRNTERVSIKMSNTLSEFLDSSRCSKIFNTCFEPNIIEGEYEEAVKDTARSIVGVFEKVYDIDIINLRFINPNCEEFFWLDIWFFIFLAIALILGVILYNYRKQNIN